ncbi:tetratricopeptide repeat protein [Kitasatospora sp. NPDC057015]|uniref:tetratricopeptide repeat protein n=1 Tax=Kitasatospora sp. NPDC057015 TaxID=3346001 RepID=UPI0036360EAE
MQDETPAEEVADRARSAFELSGRLVASGRYEEALAATDEAARLLREAGTAAPSTGTVPRPRTPRGRRTGPDAGPGSPADLLAYALVLRCEALAKLGRWDDCLRTATEAVAMARAQQTDVPFAAPLAATLLGLGTALWGLGRPQEAVVLTRESVRLYRGPARTDVLHRVQLATALNLLGVVLSRLGLHVEALKVTKESVTLHRRLAATDPATHTPGLAQALNNLARRLSARNRSRRALKAAQEAVALFRKLAAVNPAVHRRDLAMGLGNVARMHVRREESLAAAQESVEILRELDRAEPGVHGALLADSLTLFAAALADLGRYAAAVEVTVQALAMMREQAAINPVARRGDLALALAFFARVRAEASVDLPAGLAAAEEAVGILRPLAAEVPALYAPALAEVLALEGRMRSTGAGSGG